MLLPCSHRQSVIEQIEPAKTLLTKMDTLHPEVLRQHHVRPEDYHAGLVFRSAVESIRGSFISSSTPGRQRYVAAVLDAMIAEQRVEAFEMHAARERYDISVRIRSALRRMAALDVKGGEGNSINICDRPLWADEFVLWCHLDGAVVNQPADGISSILFSRVAGEMVRNRKHVDAVLVKDMLCGSPVRPCPKYGSNDQCNGRIAPDVYLLPQRVPTYPNDPDPPVHTRETLELPFLILDHYGVTPAQMEKHVYEVHVKLVAERGVSADRLDRVVTVFRGGEKLAERRVRGRQ